MIQVVAGALVYGEYVLVAKRPESQKWGDSAWEFPGGKVEQGETTSQALIREIFEELEIHLTGPLMFLMLKESLPYGIHLFVTEVQDQRWSKKSHEEIQWIHWKKLDQVPFLKSNVDFIAPLQDWFKKKGFK